ncbi:sulfite exporter TauE/SafE family protein [Oceanicella sp. SM1341]|uniref:sulfite exporter TauE/SafE family protein n=1 Tax=Oceanicella sp. SM1341 TaxID=1548889 RepID=UPI000E54788A|nr:sulfite exporter TauE/SafE family protein [Oceanicella sp. SM1341]
MGTLFDTLGWAPLALSFAVMLLAGFIKGAVGFALPMIAVSGLGMLLPPQLAVAALILPALASNIWQALHQGPRAALGSLRRHALLVGVMLVTIVPAAQALTLIPDRALFLVLGTVVSGACALQLSGWTPPDPGDSGRVAAGVGLVAGISGGLAAVWGPPIVLYLLARGTDKRESVRVQGIAYLLGSVVLALAHLRSGLIDRETAPFSALLVLPAMLGMVAGLRLQARLPQARFRRLTMLVLLLAGLNLLRRGLTG